MDSVDLEGDSDIEAEAGVVVFEEDINNPAGSNQDGTPHNGEANGAAVTDIEVAEEGEEIEAAAGATDGEHISGAHLLGEDTRHAVVQALIPQGGGRLAEHMELDEVQLAVLMEQARPEGLMGRHEEVGVPRNEAEVKLEFEEERAAGENNNIRHIEK